MSFILSGFEKAGCDAARARAARAASDEGEGEGGEDDGVAFEFDDGDGGAFPEKPPCERDVGYESRGTVPDRERVDQALCAVANRRAMRGDEPEGVARGRRSHSCF